MECLAEGANSAVLTKRSVRIFIDLMWREYQGAIIGYIFVPYILYLYALSALSGRVLGAFVGGLRFSEYGPSNEDAGPLEP